jgi:CrcB protein
MKMLLVAAGGAVGSMARYQIGAWVLARTESWAFPLGTFIVNVLGCLIAGALIGVAEYRNFLTLETRLLVFTGFLGGFTTFSAFGVETVALIERGQYGVATGYVLASVACGIGALFAAVKLCGA